MRTRVALVVFLSALAYAQDRSVVQFEQLDEIKAVKCKGQVPDGFGCAILFDLDFLDSQNMIFSVVGGVIGQLSVILDITLYTVRYDPPLTRDDKFFEIGRNARIPARADGEIFISDSR